LNSAGKLQMNRIILSLFLLAGLFLVSCQSTEKKEKKEVPKIEFEQRVVTEESLSCSTDTTHCAKVRVIYPQIEKPDSNLAKINDSITAHVKAILAGFVSYNLDIQSKNIQKLAREFISDYEESLAQDFGERIPWIIEINGKVLSLESEFSSFELSSYSYTGGAHPNSFVVLMSFDIDSGEKLEVEDFVINTPLLEELGVKYFRETRKLSAGESLGNAGYFWGEGFFFPENMALTHEGLLFYYTPYEAAAYALGATSFTIPYKELKGVISDEFLLNIN